MRLERPLHGGRPSARRHPHAHRPLAAARHEPRVLQGRARRLRPRRVQRQGARAPGRAKDRRDPGQSEFIAVRQRRGRQQARARNLRRRREVRARRDRGPARRRRGVLPALARHGRAGGAQPADLCLRRRRHRPHRDPDDTRACAAGAHRASARRSADQGVFMSSVHSRSLRQTAQVFDAARYRAEFPILAQEVHGKPLVYLDNAATTQKPRRVIEAIEHYYTADNANIHRGVHLLSQRATDAYEAAREGINLVAQSYGRPRFKPGDEILITEMEHHSNIVPWQLLCEQTGAVLKVVPINEAGELMLDEFHKLLSPRTKLVGVVHISNALGTVNPVQEIIAAAHAVGAVVLLDGAQAVAHAAVDVQALDCDFYVFSSHKLYGPTGMGVLYGKRELLEAMPPYQGGGDMIRMVTFDKTEYNALPYKFEAGTPHIAGGIGLGAAIDYVTAIGLDNVDRLIAAIHRVHEVFG